MNTAIGELDVSIGVGASVGGEWLGVDSCIEDCPFLQGHTRPLLKHIFVGGGGFKLNFEDHVLTHEHSIEDFF